MAINNCPKCGSTNIDYQVVNEVHLKNKHKGCLYWLIIGWWLHPLLWIFATVPVLIVKIFSGRKQKAVNRQKTVRICKDCGKTF